MQQVLQVAVLNRSPVHSCCLGVKPVYEDVKKSVTGFNPPFWETENPWNDLIKCKGAAYNNSTFTDTEAQVSHTARDISGL